MPEYVVVVLDPLTDLPLQGVEVEAHSLTTGLMIDKQSSDVYGAVSFSLADAASFHARTFNKPTIYQVVEPAGGIGSGPFAYDYLVDKNWATIVAAGGGTEGQSFTTFHGWQFNVYSTIGGAISAANTLNTAGQIFTIGVVPGTYDEQISWPDSDTYAYSGLLIRGLGTTDDHGDEQQAQWITSGATQSPILLDAVNPLAMQLENLHIEAVPGWESIRWTAGVNLAGHAFNCTFPTPVEMKTSGFWFDHCRWNSGTGRFVGFDSDDLHFDHCEWNGAGIALDFHTNDDPFSEVDIAHCNFIGCTVAIKLSKGVGMTIDGNHFTGNAGGQNNTILLDTASSVQPLHDVEIANNLFSHKATTTNALIELVTGSSSAPQIWDVRVVDNSFAATYGAVAATTAHVKATGNASGKIYSLTVAHNAFGHDNSGADTIEDNGGFSVIGDYVEGSIFGPNTLINKAKYKITNGANNLFIPESADVTGPPGSGSIGATVSQLKFTTDTELTIASGAITVTQTHHTIDTQADAATDDLDTINGLVANQLYFLYPANDARSIVFKHGTDNILCIGNLDITLDDAHDFVWAFSPDGSNVYVSASPPARFGEWDVILAPTGSSDAARIQAAIDAGARRILLLDGAWDVSDSVVTFAAGTEILGQTRAGTILSWGTVNYNQFVIGNDCLVGNFTVNTAPTDGGAPPIIFSGIRNIARDIDFGASSGNGIDVGGGASAISSILNCSFLGLPDSNTGQIFIGAQGFVLIQNCFFGGGVAAGAAIYNKQTGSDFFPRSNIVITGCYGTTKCGEGWFDDSDSARESTVTMSGNSVAQAGANAPMAVNIANAVALIVGNSFIVPTGQATAAAMINVTGGSVIIENNRLDANSERTDIIDISTGGHNVTGNLIRGTATNAIHLTAGNNSVLASNVCPGNDIQVAVGSTGNVIALNTVNAIDASAALNQIGLNVTGV